MQRLAIKELKDWKTTRGRKPLVLRGARQVGKTHLLAEFGKSEFSKSHYLNFEKNSELNSIFEKDLDPKRIVRDIELLLHTTINAENDLLIFDEIQYCPRALTSLKYFCEDFPQQAVCAAGSLLGVTLGEASFPVGKIDFLEIYPLSFYEFLLALEENRLFDLLNEDALPHLPEAVHLKLLNILKMYWVTGGLPEIVKLFLDTKDSLQNAFQKIRERQILLLQMYIADMAKHSGQENAMHLERVWRSIPTQLGHDQDAKSGKFVFKGVVPGIKSYNRLVGVIDWLQNAKLLIKVPIVTQARIPLTAFVKENNFKLYCFDVGILGALGDIPPHLIYGADLSAFRGLIVENFIAQELQANKCDKIYSWRGKSSEIEFVLQGRDEVIPIEVKSGKSTKSKSLNIFIERYHTRNAVIFSALNTAPTAKQSSLNNYPLYYTNFRSILNA